MKKRIYTIKAVIIILLIISVFNISGCINQKKCIVQTGVPEPPVKSDTIDLQPAEKGEKVEFPRILAFRTAEAMHSEADYAQYSLFDLVHAGGNSRLIRKYNPLVPIISHWRLGVAPKPGLRQSDRHPVGLLLSGSIWPGHWLLYNGTKLTSDLAADPSAMVIRVEDTSVFQSPAEGARAYGPDDIQIYALDRAGQPLFDQCEQVLLESIDSGAGTITVSRGRYETKPLAFRAGRAVVAVHARTTPLGGPEPHIWRLNMTFHCPRDPEGRTAVQFLGRLLGKTLLELEEIDGVEFDMAEWNVASRTITSNRTFDADNDLKGDWCYFEHQGVGLVNEHGLGLVACVGEIRRIVGKSKIIQSDAEMRAYTLLNGIEEEYYTGSERHDPRVSASQFDRIRYSLSRSDWQPKISYMMVKRPTDRYPISEKAKCGNNLARLGITSSLMCGAYFTYNSVEARPSERQEIGFGRIYLWDEYDGGDLVKKNYLGRPLGPFRRLEGRIGKTNLLAGIEKAEVHCKPGSDARCRYDAGSRILNVEIMNQCSVPRTTDIRVVLPLCSGVKGSAAAPYTLRGEVRAMPGYGRIDPAFESVPARIYFEAGTLAWKKEGAMPSVLADGEWRPLNVPLYSRDGFIAVTICFGQDPGTCEFRSLEFVAGDDFVMWRRFDNGIALLNGSMKPASFDLKRIDPERYYRAIKGTITPDVNHGKLVEVPVMVPALDGRVLLVHD